MLSNDQEPTYNLKVVVRETSLKPDTLRAWERRYGLPQPKRTAGGHRLYSQRDIDILKWLVARQRDGLSISRAVDLWHQLESEGKNPLEAPVTALVTPPIQEVSPNVRQAMGDLGQRWLEACMAFDEAEAERVLTEAFSIYPPETVCLELIMRGLADIGEGWYQGEITVHQEHFASSLATRRIETLLSAAPSPTKMERIIVGCPSDEEHVFSPLLLTLLLRRRGWDVVYLGANVPPMRLETTLATTTPQLVVLAAQQLPSAANLQDMGSLLKKLDVSLAYGGKIFNDFPELRKLIPGHFLGEKLEDALETIAKLLISPAPAPTIEKLGEIYQKAGSQYRRYQSQIESEVWQAMHHNTTDTLYQHLNLPHANKILGQNIVAALKMGNLNYIGSDLMWIKGVLNNHQLPTELLKFYLNVYSQAVTNNLGSSGEPITSWLNALLSSE